MPSLSAKDRVSLCQFSFADGRRCRTPRTGKNPHFCFDHAQKEARALAEESLSKDLAYFFSGDYLSACDLSTALGRLIPAVIRGDVKSKTARTVAYMAQTLLQTIHLSKHEYINAFDTDNWRDSIRKSVRGNYHHRFPFTPSAAEGPASPRSGGLQAGPAPVVAGLQTGEVQSPQPAPPPTPAQQPTPPQTQAETHMSCHSERSEESAFCSSPAPSPHTPLPPTGAEFAQQLLAGLPRSERPGPTAETQPTPAPTPARQSAPSLHTTANTPSVPATQSAPPPVPTPPSACPEPRRAGPEQCQTVNPAPPRRPNEPNRDAPWWNFGDSGNIPPDSHLL